MDHWLALDVGGTKIRQAVVARDGFIQSSRTWTGAAVAEPSKFRDELVAEWRASRAGRPLGVGIAIAAMVDPVGYVRAAPNLVSWEGLNLVEIFQRELGCPVHVVFDGTAALLGELWLGSPGVLNGFAISIGTGIGGGLVVDGQVLYGAHRLSGMPTSGLISEPEGLEALASGPAVAAAAGVDSGVEALRRRREGDQLAVAAFERASRALYEAIAAVTATVDVDTVMVAGGFGAGAFDFLFPDKVLPDEYRRYRLVHDDVRIRAAVTGALAPLLGAARYAALQEGSNR
ncbi:MAG: ROK family protein [Acidimicrobiales bacterium]